jgi:hypothetical protein
MFCSGIRWNVSDGGSEGRVGLTTRRKPIHGGSAAAIQAADGRQTHPALAAPRTVPRVPLCWGEGLSVALKCMRMALVLAGFCDPEQPAEFERRSGRRHRDRQSPGRRLASPHGWVHGVSRCRLPDRLLQIQPLFNVHKTPPMPQPIPRRSSRSDVRLSPAGLFLIMAPLTKPLSPTPGPPK